MNVNEITYGIEIECYVSSRVITRGELIVGEYHNGMQIPGLPQGWNCQRDSSLNGGQPRGKRGVEIVSPKLSGTEGLKQIKQVCELLRRWRATTSDKCGFHVHVGWNQSPAEVQKLVNLVANFEQGIFATTGMLSRTESTYCRSIRDTHRNIDIASRSRMAEVNSGAVFNRYHTLNLSNLATGRKPTVEFRAFAGTTEYEAIVGYVRMCVAFVEKALSGRKVKFDGKAVSDKSGTKRKGEGATQVARMYYGLGWTKGRVDRPFGAIIDENDAEIPSLESSKKILMGKAQQFDAEYEAAHPQPLTSPASTTAAQ